MKTSSRYASSVLELTRGLGVTPTTYYRLRKEIGSPEPVRLNGNGKVGHSYNAWRKFMRKKLPKMPSEKADLELQILRIKAEREAHELAKSRDEMREQINGEYQALFHQAITTLISELRRMVAELSPRFESMSGREIFSLWKSRQQVAFDRASLIFLGKEPSGKNRSAVVVPFERKAVTG